MVIAAIHPVVHQLPVLLMSQDPRLLRHRSGRLRTESPAEDQLHILKSQVPLAAHQFVIVPVIALDNFKNPTGLPQHCGQLPRLNEIQQIHHPRRRRSSQVVS